MGSWANWSADQAVLKPEGWVAKLRTPRWFVSTCYPNPNHSGTVNTKMLS